MKKELKIPEGVEITINEREIIVKGPKGEVKKDFDNPRYNNYIKIESGDKFILSSDEKKKAIRRISGTMLAHVRNMITGVSKGYEYKMKIYYAHFPINVEVKDKEVHINNFLGEKAPRIVRIKNDVEIKASKDSVIIKGNDIEGVGQTAADIENVCKITLRDRRIFNDGVYIDVKGVQE